MWGVSQDEMSAPYPCDDYLLDPDDTWFRGVTVEAGGQTAFRWLCQLRVAPYSYDLVDNFGRRSPQEFTPGADRLALGQPVMTIFELMAFCPGEHLTLRLIDPAAIRIFGQIALSYVVAPRGPARCRLIVKMALRDQPLQPVARPLLGWGDLAMMRRQLLNLRHLAERHERQRLG